MIDDLTLADAPDAAALSNSFGWPHRVEDWRWFLGLGQGVGWRHDGALLGTAMFFPLDPGHGSIGLVQVSEALQGRGIGRRLMQAVMELGQGRSLLLHSTTEGARLYESLGFVAGGAVRQWQGIAQPGDGPSGMAETEDLAGIAMMDAAATGLFRDELLRRLAGESTAVVSGAPGARTGYAMRRRFGRGTLIGPVVAGDEAEAIRLVSHLQTPGFVRVDVVGGSVQLETALSRTGLACVGEVQAMVRGGWPAARGPSTIFALGSQAFG